MIYAGAAHVVIHSSYLSGGKYETEGISYALDLYNRAVRYAPDSYHVTLLNLSLLGRRKLLAEMRTALDRICEQHSEAQTDMGYIFAEMDYWKEKSNLDEYQRWANRGLEHARNNIHRLTVLNRIAGTYLSQPNYAGAKEALAYYEKVVTIDSEDPWAWHNMSIIHRHNGNFEKTAYCNYRALELMPFGNAFDVLKVVLNRFAKGRHKDPIQEIARYEIVDRKLSGK